MSQPSLKSLIHFFRPILLGLPCLLALPSFSAGTMREMTSMPIVQDIQVGWNLGNTLDAWGNGVTG